MDEEPSGTVAMKGVDAQALDAFGLMLDARGAVPSELRALGDEAQERLMESMLDALLADSKVAGGLPAGEAAGAGPKACAWRVERGVGGALSVALYPLGTAPKASGSMAHTATHDLGAACRGHWHAAPSQHAAVQRSCMHACLHACMRLQLLQHAAPCGCGNRGTRVRTLLCMHTCMHGCTPSGEPMRLPPAAAAASLGAARKIADSMLLAHKQRQMEAEVAAATSAARRRLQAGGVALPQQTAVSVVCVAPGCSVTLENVTFAFNTGALRCAPLRCGPHRERQLPCTAARCRSYRITRIV